MNDNDAPSKITINGQEFDITEAQELIDTGRKTRDYEQKYNTKLDSVWPEYTKATQERKKFEDELTEAKKQLQEFETKKVNNVETPTDVKNAREAAKKLGIVLEDDLSQSGYIKKDELEEWYNKRKTNEQQSEQIVKQAEKFAEEIDGKDGRPKFKKNLVLPYMAQFGISDMTQAYEMMYEDELKEWKEAQIAAEKRKGIRTLNASGQKAPVAPKVNDSNFQEMLRESLYGNNEE